MISVIVTAYKAQNFIEPCLDSISRQIYFNKHPRFEILLGIDNCRETLRKVKGLGGIKNLKIFMMKENYGTYIVSNTLIDNAKYNRILRFDSDDVMRKDMIGVLMKQKADVVRMKYFTFGKRRIGYSGRYSWGQVLFSKKVFDVCGGYSPWRCAADKDLLNRAGLKFKIARVDDRLFYKRMHPGALTKAKNTGAKSNIRKIAHNKIRENINSGIVKIERVTGEYEIM